MKNTRRTDTSTALDTDDGVERPAPGEPPTAWRIWKFGDNDTSHGPTVFTKKSAKLVLEEQELRGVKYSIDVDHKSLDPDASLEDRRAVGWHSIEVRADGLWACAVEWSKQAAQWLRDRSFRYASAAYDVNRETGEVVSYTNISIVTLPATFGTVSLAANRTTTPSSSSVRGTSAPCVRWSGGNVQHFGGVPDAAEPRGDERASMNARMGLGSRAASPKGGVTRAGRTQVFRTITPDDVRRERAAKK